MGTNSHNQAKYSCHVSPLNLTYIKNVIRIAKKYVLFNVSGIFFLFLFPRIVVH